MSFQAKQTLQAVGSSNGAQFQNDEVWIRDTVFINPSTALVDMDFFGNDAKDEMWKSKVFPSNTQAFALTHLRIDFGILFSNTDPLLNNAKLKYFLNNSVLHISNEGDDVVKIPLYELVNFEIRQADNQNGTASFYGIRDKFNNIFKLAKPVIVPAGGRPDVKIVPAKEVSTAAYSATLSPYIKKAGSALSTADQGNYIMVEFKGVKSKVNG